MKATRFKGILLIILALLNAFLLILLLVQQSQQRNADRRSVEELSLLYEKNGISLSADQIPQSRTVYVPSIRRNRTEEAAFAQSLLGSVETASDESGVYRYHNESGFCRIRANGTVDALCQCKIKDIASFCRNLEKDFGYREIFFNVKDGSGTVKAERVIDKIPMSNATLIFTFQDQFLTAVSGTFLPKEDSKSITVSLDTLSAMVTFLNYRNTSGLVCTKIENISVCYYAENTAAALSIIPAIRIETNVATYYVNPVNNTVFR